MVIQKILTRDFVLSLLAQFTSTSVFSFLIPTLPIYLSRQSARDAEIGVLVGVLSVSSLVLRPFVGRALLRIAEKKFMAAGALIYALSSLAYLVAPPFWPFFLVRIFQGIGMAFFSTASLTLVANIAPDSHRGRMISYLYLSINIAFAIAPSLGMLIINHFSFDVLFFFCGALSFCSLFFVSKLKERTVEPLEVPPASDSSFFHRETLPSGIMAFMINTIWGALTAFFPLYAISHGVANPGLFFAAFAFIMVFARGFGGKILDMHSRDKVILPCLITFIAAMTLLIFSTTLPLFILVALIWGLGNAFLYPSLIALALDRAGSSAGPAMGTFTAFADLGSGLGAVIMGVVLQLTNYTVMFLCVALTTVINLLYFIFFVRGKGGRQYADL